MTTTTTPCPGNDTIAELVCRQLGDAKTAELEAHIADCAPCRRLVGTLAAGTLPRLVGDPPSSAEPARGDDQRYVIREELARGGMGRISIAFDTLLGRMVAIKELLAPSAALAARFQRELALTSRLQHPSIVSIHDGGTWPSGEPFYVMRLVSGQALDRVIARHDDVAARLGLLPHGIAMVDALAYAHSQGIIHRDLKPANVLVGDFGETVVIDWGLAKDVHASEPAEAPIDATSDNAATVAGLVIGTPAYMSPEQARGEPADERSDVYALGAVLYHVLGGIPPYAGREVEAIVRAVRADSPRSLAEVAPGIPPDLVTIVGKAMARRADDRYPTASELAADLKRFQRGQLVAAHRYSSRQLVARWVRKHRTAVAVGAVAVVAVVAITTAAFVRVTTAQHGAEAARGDAEDLMQFMLTDLHDKLTPIGKLDILGAVAHKERDYYLAHADDQSARRAVALGNLGDVLAAQGDPAAAASEDRAALELANRLAAREPGSAAVQQTLAMAHSRLASVLFEQGDVGASVAEGREAVRVLHQLADPHPDDSTSHGALATEQLRLGQSLEQLGNTDEALAMYRDCLASATRFLGADLKWQQVLAETHERIGHVLDGRGDRAGTLVERRAALAAQEQLVAREPDNTMWQQELVLYHDALGGSLEVGDPAAALVEYRAAQAIGERLVARDATNLDWQRRLATTRQYAAAMLIAQGDVANAIVEYRAVLAELLPRATRDPNNAALQRDLYHLRSALGDALAMHDAAAAVTEYQAALPIAEGASARDPNNVPAQMDVAVLRNRIAGGLIDRGDVAGGLAAYRATVAALVPLAKRAPRDINVKSAELAASLGVGEALLKHHEAEASIAQYRDAMIIANAIAALGPDSAVTAQDLVAAHTGLGDALLVGHAVDALVEYRAAIALAEQAAGPKPSADWQDSLADGHTKLGDALARSGDHAHAVVEYRAALALATALAATDPANSDWKQRVVVLRTKR